MKPCRGTNDPNFTTENNTMKNKDIEAKRLGNSVKRPKHTEDCVDANDDTSVFKGKCICPHLEKQAHTPTPLVYKEVDIISGFKKTKGWHLLRPITNTGVACSGTNTDEGKAIHRAVNAYEKDQETIRDLIQALKAYGHCTSYSGTKYCPCNNEPTFHGRANDSIAKAEQRLKGE